MDALPIADAARYPGNHRGAQASRGENEICIALAMRRDACHE